LKIYKPSLPETSCFFAFAGPAAILTVRSSPIRFTCALPFWHPSVAPECAPPLASPCRRVALLNTLLGAKGISGTASSRRWRSTSGGHRLARLWPPLGSEANVEGQSFARCLSISPPNNSAAPPAFASALKGGAYSTGPASPAFGIGAILALCGRAVPLASTGCSVHLAVVGRRSPVARSPGLGC
jgi:hypothetical protein